MTYYAKIVNNIVSEVVKADLSYIEGQQGVWIRTDKDTRAGVHYTKVTNIPSADQTKAFRKNYAGVGHTYDATRDAFIPPSQYLSWKLNEQTCIWDCPKPYPEDDGKEYEWSEAELDWKEI